MIGCQDLVDYLERTSAILGVLFTGTLWTTPAFGSATLQPLAAETSSTSLLPASQSDATLPSVIAMRPCAPRSRMIKMRWRARSYKALLSLPCQLGDKNRPSCLRGMFLSRKTKSETCLLPSRTQGRIRHPESRGADPFSPASHGWKVKKRQVFSRYRDPRFFRES